jgi:hypothetical protein
MWLAAFDRAPQDDGGPNIFDMQHHTSNSGTSIQRRSFQLLSPASAS